MLMGKRRERMDIARIIREARERKGLSQIDLAAQLDCHHSTICGWEGEGERKHAARLAIERTLRMCRVLDLNPAKLG